MNSTKIIQLNYLPNFQLRYIIDKFMDLREQQKKILESDPKFTIGDVTTINLNQVFVSICCRYLHTYLTI